MPSLAWILDFFEKHMSSSPSYLQDMYSRADDGFSMIFKGYRKVV